MQTHVHTQALKSSDQSLGEFLCHAGSFIQRGSGCEQTISPTQSQTFFILCPTFFPCFVFIFSTIWKDPLQEHKQTVSGFRVRFEFKPGLWHVAGWTGPAVARTVLIRDCLDSPEDTAGRKHFAKMSFF